MRAARDLHAANDAAPAPAVVVNELARVYPGVAGRAPVHALGPISLTIARGEFFSVVGPSGCGKSTLFDLLAGLGTPSSGTVEFEGKRVDGTPPDGIGAVFQEDASFPWLSVYDNAAFALRQQRMPPAEIRERVDETLALIGLRPFADAFPAQLSGGMRQRLCIARTLVTRPRLLLLDEPFGALDQQTRLLMGDELLNLWRRTGATIVLITHSLDEATLLSDRIGVMSARPGVFMDLVETGWPRDRDSTIVSQPAFGAVTGRLWDVLRRESLRAMESSR